MTYFVRILGWIFVIAAVSIAAFIFAPPQNLVQTPEIKDGNIMIKSMDQRVSSTTPPAVSSATTTPKQTAPKPASVMIPKPPATAPSSVPLPVVTPPAPIVVNTDELYAQYRPAVMNIWCEEGNKVTTGTATMIDLSGILITNSHVVKDIKNINNCVLRRANPFEIVGRFKILFMPTQTAIIPNTDFSRNDFALLKITDVLISHPTPDWEYVPVSSALPNADDTLFVFGYGTEFVGYIIAVKGIPLTFSTFTVREQATLDENLKDSEAVLLTSSISNQGGNSGGPLVDNNKNVVAILSFVSSGSTTGDRTGVGLLISYVDYVMKAETGMSLGQYIQNQR